LLLLLLIHMIHMIRSRIDRDDHDKHVLTDHQRQDPQRRRWIKGALTSRQRRDQERTLIDSIPIDRAFPRIDPNRYPYSYSIDKSLVVWESDCFIHALICRSSINRALIGCLICC
jgi:hypothetical protein